MKITPKLLVITLALVYGSVQAEKADKPADKSADKAGKQSSKRLKDDEGMRKGHGSTDFTFSDSAGTKVGKGFSHGIFPTAWMKIRWEHHGKLSRGGHPGINRRQVEHLSECVTNADCSRDGAKYCAQVEQISNDGARPGSQEPSIRFCEECTSCSAQTQAGLSFPMTPNMLCPRCNHSRSQPQSQTEGQYASSSCGQLHNATGAAFSENSNRLKHFMLQCGSQLDTIEVQLAKVVLGKAGAHAVCHSPCLNDYLDIMARTAQNIDEGNGHESCHEYRSRLLGAISAITGVICAKSSAGFGCAGTLQNYSNMILSLHSTAYRSDMQTLTATCASFNAAGCCMASVHTAGASEDFQLFTRSVSDGTPDDLEASLTRLKNTCRAASLPHTNIGAYPCRNLGRMRTKSAGARHTFRQL